MENTKKGNGNGNGMTTIYSPERLAEIMEVKKTFVMRLLREGKLKGFKMGKFWRIPVENLQAFFAAMNENGNGKKRMGVETKNKIRFHANLKSQDTLPKTVEEKEETVLQLKDDLQNQTGFKKVAVMAKLQSAVTIREELKARLGSMDESLHAIGSKAYPELMLLADKDPDSLETLFAEAANGKKMRMVDFIDKEALEMVADKKAGEKEVIPAPANEVV